MGWALIALVGCVPFVLGRRLAAVGLRGSAALFIRELAAPYCVVCTLLALRDRQWREVAAWLAGAAGVCGCTTAGTSCRSLAHRLPADFAHGESWLTFLGCRSSRRRC